MKRPSLLLALICALGATPVARANEAAGQSAGGETRPSVPAFTATTLDTLARVPVQHEGRVKPLSTYAGYTMLGLHHKRTLTLPGDQGRLGPTAWWLRTVLFPEVARHDLVIRIEDSDVLDQIGLADLKASKRKRDVYSFEELAPGYRRLREKYRTIVEIDSKQQTRDQKMLIALAHQLFTLEDVMHTLIAVAQGVELRTDEVRAQFEGRSNVRLSESLARLQDVIESGEQPEWANELARMTDAVARESGRLRLMAPLKAPDGETADWYAVGDIVNSVFGGDPAARANIAFMAKLEEVVSARSDPQALETAMDSLYGDARARAESSGAYDKIEFEVSYYRLALFSRALYVFLAGFLVLAATWLWPRSVWLYRALWGFAVLGAGLVTWGIVMRCILLGRPPVATLYETILFVTGCIAISGLIMEWINKRRIGIGAVIVLGALGMFIAGRHEDVERRDTMGQLVAVLNTNFWLATHVTCITLGYAAGLLAAGIAHIYVLGKAFRFKRDDNEFYRGINRMVYGTLCFSLLFSVVGTILGGVWANDSWGRFWGWDPKENGALMIVLSQLAILHGRMAGYLKPFGLSMATIAGGGVIAFSWWGVNQLQVGLHSYGFSENVSNALNAFYLTEIVVLAVGGSLWLYDRYSTRRAA